MSTGTTPAASTSAETSVALTTTDAWEALALECDQLAQLAARVRDQIAAGQMTDIDEIRAVHTQVDEAARSVQSLASASRRSTYVDLKRGLSTWSAVARAFGVSEPAVNKVRGRGQARSRSGADMNRTQLRHEMLTAVSRGKVSMDGSWRSKVNPATQSRMAQALTELLTAGYIKVIDEGRVELSDRGRALLARWDGRRT